MYCRNVDTVNLFLVPTGTGTFDNQFDSIFYVAMVAKASFLTCAKGFLSLVSHYSNNAL